MDQGSNYIRQDIDSTRVALNDKINTLEANASQAFDLKYQVSERPWLMLGAAVATGYVLGSLIGDDDDRYRSSSESASHSRTSSDDYRYKPSSSSASAGAENNEYRYTPSSTSASGNYPQQPSQPQAPSQGGFLSQFDDEIDMLKAAAIDTIRNLLRDTVREYAPAVGRQLDQMSSQQSSATGGSSGMHQNMSGNSPGSNSARLSQTYDPTSSTSDRDYVKTYHPSGS